MKKLKKIAFIDLKRVFSFISSVVLLFATLFSTVFFVSEKFDSDFLNMIVHFGTKEPYTLPDTNVAKAVLSVSVPGISFAEPEQKKVEPLIVSTSVPSHTLLPPAPENTSLSITYESSEEKGYKSTQGIYLNNQTTKEIDVAYLLNKELDLSLSDAPTVLIIHTHTTESYTPSEKYNYTPTDTDRTTDENFNMTSVGGVIYDHLTASGINTIHDKTVNDYPSYSKSYSNSLKLVESYMREYPSIKIVIDVHRDAIVSKNGEKMRPVANFDPVPSQVMAVIGTNESGLNHPSWENNLSFAIKLQHEMNSLYPTLARPINLRRERFNQHLAPYAFILEVGTNGNTLDEAKEGARLFASSLVSLLKN